MRSAGVFGIGVVFLSGDVVAVSPSLIVVKVGGDGSVGSGNNDDYRCVSTPGA